MCVMVPNLLMCSSVVPAFRKRAVRSEKHKNREPHGEAVKSVRATPSGSRRNLPYLISRNAAPNPDILFRKLFVHPDGPGAARYYASSGTSISEIRNKSNVNVWRIR